MRHNYTLITRDLLYIHVNDKNLRISKVIIFLSQYLPSKGHEFEFN